MFKGVAGSTGVGIGNAVLAKDPDLSYVPHATESAEAENARFDAALDKYCERTQGQADRLRKKAGDAEAEIIEGHILMARDPFMKDEICRRIGDGMCAEQAVDEVCDMFKTMFENMDDKLMQERAADVEDIRSNLLANLLNRPLVDLSNLPADSIVIVNELTPSMTADIDKDHVVGIITAVGGYTSHAAIIARSLEIPCVLSVPDAMSICESGDTLVVDGTKGSIHVKPPKKKLAEYKERRAAQEERKQALEAYRGKKTVTADGIEKILVANIGLPDDCAGVLEHDAEGIGLFRSEFVFMNTDALPDEDTQFDAYQKVTLRLKDMPIIIRTLDVGGDKHISYLNIAREDNPFMGYRAVRYCLKNPELYKVQLRAILRSSAFGDVKIMVPMVTCVDEMLEVRKLVQECKLELAEKNIDYNPKIEIGAMIETPAACLIADKLASVCDFFSIGTNDLTGYTMCADRGNDAVSYLYSTYNPAVLRSIQMIIKAANEANIMVGMCGEAAADPLLVPLLISFGLDEFSVGSPSVLRTRKVINDWTKKQADELADYVMKLNTEAEVKHALEEASRRIKIK